jgi:FAD/FMN-containing dehydrogenase
MPSNAQLVFKNHSSWTNKHENFTVPIAGIYDVWNPDSGDLVADLRTTVGTLQGLIAEALGEGRRLRALGSGWSFSKVAVTDGTLINTRPLNAILTLSDGSIDARYTGDKRGLVLAQCGNQIGELNRYLLGRGRSLRASGASNGQTIAGAVSTGTHGSAFDVGAVPDSVVGLHLIVGPSRHVWLERASAPVVTESFAQKLGAELRRNDGLFEAALVSFGSFGILHALLIETDPIFLLEAHRSRMPFDAALRRAIATLDLSGLPLPDPGTRPYHFEVIVNPHDLDRGVYVRTIYKRAFDPAHHDPTPGAGGNLEPGDDLPGFLGMLGDLAPALIPPMVNALIGDRIKEVDGKVRTLGGMFDNTSTRGKAASTAIGVPLSQTGTVLDTILAVHRETGPFPGAFALRFVKQSKALLGFTRFAPTCVVELDGVASEGALRLYRRVWARLAADGVPFTLHWGKINDYLDAGRVRRMYGAAADRWLAARRTLLDPPVRAVFNSPFLTRLDLDD